MKIKNRKKLFVLLILLVPLIFISDQAKAETAQLGVNAWDSSRTHVANVEYDIYSDNCTSGTKLTSGSTLAVGFASHDLENGSTICLKPTKVPSGYKLPSSSIKTISGNTTHTFVLEADTTVTQVTRTLSILAGEKPDKGNGKIAGVKYSVYTNLSCTGTPLYDGVTKSDSYNEHAITFDSTSTVSYCIKTTEVPTGYKIPSNITGTINSDVSGIRKEIPLYDIEEEPDPGEPSTESTTYTIGLRSKKTNKYIDGVITIKDGTVNNGTCSGNTLLTKATVFSGSITELHGTVSTTGRICIQVNSISDGYDKPEPQTFTYSADGEYIIDVESSSSTEVTTPVKIKFGFKYKNKFVSGINFAVYKNLSSSKKCTTILKNGTSVADVKELEFSTLDSLPSKVCIEVDQNSLGNYSVSQYAEYEVDGDTVIVTLNEKVPVDDTMSNVSIIVISAGVIVLILGGYLLYTNKINKEENSTEN